MEVLSLTPLPVAALLWSAEQRGWSLTVICKATFDLVPGALPLASDQIPIHRGDRHWNDDAKKSVYAPSDLAPFKPRVDVLVVGHAYAPGALPRASLTASLSARGIDKRLVVRGARVRDEAGNVGPAASFKRMPLHYEGAPGGADSENPVGIPIEGQLEADGAATLPSLEPSPGRTAEGPLGFGPIAATWPSRLGKLGRHHEGWSHTTWYERAIPRELDLGYFNAAPNDQQIERLSPGDEIILENLNRDHPRLVFTIPAVEPVAYVERAAGEAELLTLRCDTLWIDTDEQTCTLTWRGQLRLHGPRESARCLVASTSTGERPSWDEVDALRASCDVPAFVDRSPISLGGPTEPIGKQLHVSVVAGPIIEPAPRSLDSSLLVDRHDDEDDPIGDQAVRSTRRRGRARTLIGGPGAAEEATPLPTAWLKLLFVAKGHGPRLIQHAPWRHLTAGTPPLRDDKVQQRRSLETILRHAESADAATVEALLHDAAARLPFEAPLVLLEGQLTPTMDALERLRATVTTITAFAQDDEELRQLLDATRELLDLHWLESADGIAEELSARLVERFEGRGRGLPPDFVTAQSERILVQERKLRRRRLWGEDWLRCGLDLGEGSSVPTYLPAAAVERLPLAPRLSVRLIAEADMREDAYESHPFCLRALCLGSMGDVAG
ncbi:MAG: DUF2169 domain-containing protein [Myxococcales bacterium]|nr:DUF2169 domain-containing protein [Myxococcales bacterium]